MKVYELENYQIDFRVELLERAKKIPLSKDWWEAGYPPKYTENVLLGYAIVDRENIQIDSVRGGGYKAYTWRSGNYYGPTPLIAAMRCHIRNKWFDIFNFFLI